MYTAKGQLDVNSMLKQYSPLVRRLAHQMIAKLPANVEIDDLIQVGMIGLSDALTRFDAELVVGSAADPIEARAAIKALNPDVLTLDVEMPGESGLAFLERLMVDRPMPVVMVSTLTAAGTDVTLAALEIGAVDAVAKPASATPSRKRRV